MHRKDAIAWVVTVCAGTLRLSQAKTLAILVGAAMHVERINLANIGRAMSGLVKHQIKRCWRFCANDRIETADAMRPILRRVLKKRKKKLLISFDWTDIKSFQTLMACAVFKGRSMPVCWASCTKHTCEGHRSRNAFEESLLLVLRSMIPPQVKLILLADRGFGRTELARFCQNQGFSYIIRIHPDVHVRSASCTGKLIDYPVHKGICKLLKSVAYLLLCGLGLIALRTGQPSQWASSTRNQCSVFTIGRIMCLRLKTTVSHALAAIMAATEQVVRNWG
ncbi:transposase [Fontivita pretiosa]|uniref:transposase n=1 Tax=Fontivita pretiosa TaxID=2989684 RepID=UPI003D17BD38